MANYFINQKNNSAVTVGGVRRLMEFMPDSIVIIVGGAQINLKGQKLKISRFDEDEIEIIGKIENVETVLLRKRAL